MVLTGLTDTRLTCTVVLSSCTKFGLKRRSVTCVAGSAEIFYILMVDTKREMLAPIAVVVPAVVTPFELGVTKVSHGMRVRATCRCPVAESAKMTAMMFYSALKRSAWLDPF